MLNLFLIAAGGAIGATLRFLTSHFTLAIFGPSSVITGTVVSNIAGCLLAGFGFGWFTMLNAYPPEWSLFFLTGIFGSYTTFSTFALEAYHLLQKNVKKLLLYFFFQLVVAFIVVYTGFKIATLIAGG